MRYQHYHLNIYNIRQISYLCEKVANLKTGDIPEQALLLLSNVTKKCNYSNISKALKEATKIKDEEVQQLDSAIDIKGSGAIIL